MSEQFRPDKEGQVFSLSMPSDYWLRRANRHKQRGDNRTAAILLRHALTIKPGDGDLRTEYAKCLQALRCFEASNRECFDVLAREPESLECYSIIGRNMLALGREQEAMDAYAHYLRLLKDAPDELIVSEDDDDVQDMFDFVYPPRAARYDCRLRLASRSMANGDLQEAGYQLARADKQHYRDERVYTLKSVLLLEKGKAASALKSAKKAVGIAPRSVQALCALAGAYRALGKTYQAFAALCRCVPLCEYAKEEQLVCFTAAELGLMPVAVNMLAHNIKHSPNRLPALYDMAIALLHLGKPDEATSYLQRCRELDPEDIPTACTFRLVRRMTQAPDDQTLHAQAGSLPFYPHLSPAETVECLAPLWEALRGDAEAFPGKVLTDRQVQSALLYALSLRQLGMEKILSMLATQPGSDEKEALLRRVLVSPLTSESAKRVASSLLVEMGASPPYVVWHEGRISQLSLTKPPRDDKPALRRLLVKIGEKWREPRLTALCLCLMGQMSGQQRALVARDGMALWGEAMHVFYGLSEKARRDPDRAVKEMKGLSLKHRIRSAVLALSDLYCGRRS